MRSRGFTLIELLISMILIAIMVSTLMAIGVETSTFVGDHDVSLLLESEGRRAMNRMTEVLRKTGWNSDGVNDYPRVLTGGDRLDFRILEDTDGNGYPFEEGTGDLEWQPTVYSIELDESGSLDIYRGGEVVLHLARHVELVTFRTVFEDSTLHLHEIAVIINLRAQNRRNEDRTYRLRQSIVMRN